MEITCPFCDYTGRKDHVQRHGKSKHTRDTMPPICDVGPTLSVFRTADDHWGFCWICYNKLPGTLTTVESAMAACKKHRCRATIKVEDVSGATVAVSATDQGAGLQSLLTDPVISPTLAMQPGDTRTLLQLVRERLRACVQFEKLVQKYAARVEELEASMHTMVDATVLPVEQELATVRRERLLLEGLLNARTNRVSELEAEIAKYEHNTRILQQRLAQAQAQAQGEAQAPAVNGFKC